ncbi:pheA operon leader peptide PheL [Erwinia persicina]|uniref:PheA operon leader peptide PheL n=1 Tax=Erwinia persicina TaxID=55211 RepID=A0ABR8ZTQ9_9GAMM|nr:pheA operon leader peptide PheL [Erwinia persicina]MBD8162443.1 pheA operon leader peptide PheL [Erwinia persicina]MBD8168031.1 pheA operon leader peptide PheL [Erwinia persicina]MBD8210134.1 pheA operon leader peptide PheL [Erwinia persicina]MBD8214913.1 pheA operon leader peptide PheL [Erwinia persicina]
MDSLMKQSSFFFAFFFTFFTFP